MHRSEEYMTIIQTHTTAQTVKQKLESIVFRIRRTIRKRGSE